MLVKVSDPYIKEDVITYDVTDDLQIFTKTLYKEALQGKTALFIHGGGSGGNHTIVLRPSYWMIQNGLFARVILPDRRGAGLSSPIRSMMTYEDNAHDMKLLLDKAGITEKITAIGISYGGPIALTLAGIDPRVEEVWLVASSPSLKAAKGVWGFMYRHNLLEPIVRFVYKQYIGKLENVYPDFDGAYDVENLGQLKKIFLNAIMHTPKERFESLMLENASTLNLNNQGVSPDLKLNMPVYRVIGTNDETWEVNLGDKYCSQIPNIKTTLIQGASHKDVFFRAQEFYDSLYNMVLKD